MKRGFLLSSSNPKPKSNPQPSSSTPNPKPSSSIPNPKPKSTSKPSQSQSHGGGGGQDRLSSLPDPILHHILSLLPTDDMVCTSALARRWAHLWTSSPVLHFTRNFTKPFELEDYPSIVDRCLSQCAASRKVSSIRFPLVKSHAFSLTADSWIRFAAAHSVEHLTFTPIFLGKLRVEMPPSLFDCRTLASLNLNSCSISAVPAKSCGFPSLTKIAFTHVTIDDVGLEALLELCPRIESLSLMSVYEISRLVVLSRSMRHLMVYKCTGLDRVEIVEAPELRRLLYCGDLLKFKNLDQGIVPKLEEAVLLSSAKDPFEDQVMWERFVAAVAHVRVLSVNSWLFQYTLGRRFSFGDQPYVFHNLKELHWWPVFVDMPDCRVWGWCADGISTYCLCALFSILRACPSMEQLCVRCTYNLEIENSEYGYLSDSSDDEWYGEEYTHQEFEGVGYELPCLKMVRIIEFSGRKEEKKLVEFLAGKATVLESMCLHYVGEVEEINEIQKERFKKYYLENRKLQLTSDFQVSSMTPFLESHQTFFAQIAGFFIVEDRILRTGGGLVTRADVDSLWEAAVAKMVSVLEDQFSRMMTVSHLLLIKDYVSLLEVTLRRYGYAVDPLLDVLSKHRDKYHDLLPSDCRRQVSEVLAADKFEQMWMMEYEYSMNVLSFQLQTSDIVPAFPFVAPFSSTVPDCCRIVRSFIEDSVCFMSYGGQLDFYAVVKKYLDWLLVEALDSSLLRLVESQSLGVFQAMQVAANMAVLERACDFFFRHAAQLSGIPLRIAERGRREFPHKKSRDAVEELLLSLLRNKIDDFMLLIDSISWMAEEPPLSGNEYANEVLIYLETLVSTAQQILPVQVLKRVVRGVLSHISDKIVGMFLSDSLKRFNGNAGQELIVISSCLNLLPRTKASCLVNQRTMN